MKRMAKKQNGKNQERNSKIVKNDKYSKMEEKQEKRNCEENYKLK